jgi:hypothetical protein
MGNYARLDSRCNKESLVGMRGARRGAHDPNLVTLPTQVNKRKTATRSGMATRQDPVLMAGTTISGSRPNAFERPVEFG